MEKLNGFYLIKLHNESIYVNEMTFTSTVTTSTQPLPSVLSNVVNKKYLLNIEQVHGISIHNIKQLQHLGSKLSLNFYIQISIAVMMGLCIGYLYHKLTKKLNLPTINTYQSAEHAPTREPIAIICGTQTFKDGGVTNTQCSGRTAHSADLA